MGFPTLHVMTQQTIEVTHQELPLFPGSSALLLEDKLKVAYTFLLIHFQASCLIKNQNWLEYEHLLDFSPKEPKYARVD